MEYFVDFLPFQEDVQEAFENYDMEAASLTISALTPTMGSVIGRVVWRSPLLMIGKKHDEEVIHLTIMDVDGDEITGTALGKEALKFHEVLEKDKIYKFVNAFPVSKQVYMAVKGDQFESRVIHQPIELRFSGVVEPELVRQKPYPNIDQSQLNSDYKKLKVGQVAAVVGLVTSQFVRNNQIFICLSNGTGECICVSFEEVKKKEEIKALGIRLFETVLGILGVAKLSDIDTKTIGDKIPKALFRTFDDTLLINEPLCVDSRHLVLWRDEARV